jgi:hypothetical protein
MAGSGLHWRAVSVPVSVDGCTGFASFTQSDGVAAALVWPKPSTASNREALPRPAPFPR